MNCDICSLSTSLDPSSVIELLRYGEAEEEEEQAGEDLSQYEREVHFSRGHSSNAYEFCREHTEEVLSYFCVDCECECICAECAIHGEHRDHEVMQIKKAYPMIKDKCEEIYMHLSNKIDEAALRSEKIESHRKEIVEQGNAARQQILVSFEDLKARLGRKEREMLEGIDRVVKEQIREAENFGKIINAKIEALEALSENFKQVLSEASQTELLDFYAGNKEKIYETIENEMNGMGNIDRISNLRCVINNSSVAEHIESIKAVQIQISALKGIEEVSMKKPTGRTKGFSKNS